MALFDIFNKKKPPTANTAKERLLIVIEHSRSGAKRPELLNQMRQEILTVVNKYMKINIDDIDTNISNKGDVEVLEVNILLPDNVDTKKLQHSE